MPPSEVSPDMIWFGAFIGLVALLILWAAVIAPGRARKLFAGLEAQGWSKVAPADEALRSTFETLQPFDLTRYLPDDGAHPESTVVDALARSGSAGPRYLVQVRVTGPDAFGEGIDR